LQIRRGIALGLGREHGIVQRGLGVHLHIPRHAQTLVHYSRQDLTTVHT
jgi:hypothetical protein